MKKSTRLLVVHLSIMSLLHSLGACQVPKMGIFSFHFMCLPSIHHIMLSCFYRIFRISTVQCEIVNQFFFSKKKKNSLCICAFSADQYLGFRDLEVCAFSSNIFQTVDLYLFILKQSDLQDSCKDGIQRDAAYFPPRPAEQSHVMGPSYPLMVCTL